MKTWAVSFDVVYNKFSTKEYWKRPAIEIVKADTGVEAMKKAELKYLVRQCGETNTAKYSYYDLWVHGWTEIDLENID